MIRQLPALALLLTASLVSAQEPAASRVMPPADDVHDFLIFKEQAFIVGRPILVSAPTAYEPSWSPTGRFLVYQQAASESNVLSIQDSVKGQRPSAPERSLCIYSLSDGKSQTIMRLDTASEEQADFYWIAGTDTALVDVHRLVPDSDVSEPAEKLYLFDAATAGMKEFNPWEGADEPAAFSVSPSPTQPYALVTGTFRHRGFSPEGKRTVTMSTQLVVMTATGKFGQVRVPDDSNSSTSMWSPDGTHAYVLTRVKVDDKAKANWYDVSLVNGSTKAIDRPSEFYQGQTKGGLISIRNVTQSSVDGKASASLNALWLETTDPDAQNRLLLAGDAVQGNLNKTMDCASYISQGSLFIRPISEVPKSRYEQAVIAWNRMELLNQAREAGTALIMYSSDFDGNFPSGHDNLNNILGPYLRDAAFLYGFVYTFPGGPASSIANPSTTQIGYLDAPDGRAVVYADGHTSWVPK